MVLSFLLLFVGLGILWWAGELTVKYAIEMAYLYNISMLFVGFIIISISTGLPELAITITSLIKGVNTLSVGAIIGSNFSDIALVLGIPAFFIQTLCIGKEEYKESVFMLFLSIGVMAFIFIWGTLSMWVGFLLVGLYIFALIKIWRLRHVKKAAFEYVKKDLKPKYKAHEASVYLHAWVIIKLLLAAVFVLLGSYCAVEATIALAKLLPWSIETISTTIMAVGTSLPELTIAIIAARRKEYSLAIGTSFGSVLEQGTLILGLLAIFSRQPISIFPFYHLIPFMFIAFAIVGYGIVKREKINKKEGGALLLLYSIFIIYEFYFKPS